MTSDADRREDLEPCESLLRGGRPVHGRRYSRQDAFFSLSGMVVFCGAAALFIVIAQAIVTTTRLPSPPMMGLFIAAGIFALSASWWLPANRVLLRARAVSHTSFALADPADLFHLIRNIRIASQLPPETEVPE